MFYRVRPGRVVLAGDECAGPEAAVGVDALDEHREVLDSGRVGHTVHGRLVGRAVEADLAGGTALVVEGDLADRETVVEPREGAGPKLHAGERRVAGAVEGQGGHEAGGPRGVLVGGRVGESGVASGARRTHDKSLHIGACSREPYIKRKVSFHWGKQGRVFKPYKYTISILALAYYL